MFTETLVDSKDQGTSHETTVEVSKSAYQHRPNNANSGTLDERNLDSPRGNCCNFSERTEIYTYRNDKI